MTRAEQHAEQLSWLRGLIRALPVAIPRGTSEADFARDAEHRRMAAMQSSCQQHQQDQNQPRKRTRTMPEATMMIDDAQLDDPAKIALYGKPAMDAERAARARAQQRVHDGRDAGDTVDLRGDDLPPTDPWDIERLRAQAHGRPFNPAAFVGLLAHEPPHLQGYDAETRRRAQAEATRKQRSRWAVCIGAAVTLRDGTVLPEGAPIDEAQIGHPRALEVLAYLRDRGVVAEIDADLAWLRSLPEDVGPWVATRDVTFSNGRSFKRGDSVREEDCPAPVLPRRLTDELKASELTVAELRQLIVAELALRVPGAVVPVPPRMSEWQLATLEPAYGLASVQRAVNYVERSNAPKKKGLFR